MNNDISPEELAQKAIKSLELAGKYEQENNVEKAIEIYQEALKLLLESGYMPHRNNDIQDHINELTQSLEEQKASKLMGIRKEVDQLQKEGFSLIEQAERIESDGLFEKAIKKYKSAISILKDAGWSENQLKKLRDKILSLKTNLDRKYVVKKQKVVRYMDQKIDTSDLSYRIQEIPEIQDSVIEAKNQEEAIKAEAFRLIDIGKELEKNEKYDEAIDQINQAIDLFKSINWGSFLQPFKDLLSQIKEKRDMKIAARKSRKMREEQLYELKESLDHKSTNIVEKPSQDKFKRLQAYEVNKKEKEEKEAIFFNHLDKADQLVKKEEFDEAIMEYNKALEHLSDMGHGWDYYIPTLQNTINTINIRKESKLNIEFKQQKQHEEILKQKEEFQEFVSKKLKVERKELENEELILKEKEKEQDYFQTQKELAFNYLNSAQNFVIKADFDNAISAYQNAGKIFAEIQWDDELILIENSINDLEEKKRQQSELKNKQMEERIRKLKEEEEFQKRINRQLDLERLKLQEKEVQLKEREKIIEYEELQKEKALNLLEQAQDSIEMGNLDKALNLYYNSRSLLTQTNYPTNIIDDMILKVEEQRKIIQYEKEKTFEIQLKREKEDEEFQVKISRSLDQKKEKLREKKIRIQEYEEKKQLVEIKRQEAFEILDQAESLVQNMEYNQAISYYRKAQIILNQIQFPTNSIAETIDKIIKLRDQKEKEKQLRYQKELERIEQEKDLNKLIRERKRKDRTQMLTENLVRIEREEIIQKQMTYRDAAYSLLEKGGDFLNISPPEYKKALSLYIEARDILTRNIGWEPEIYKINELINEIRKEETEYLNRTKRERLIELNKQREQQQYLDDIEKRKLELRKKEIDRIARLREFALEKEKLNQIQSEAFEYIDKGKKYAMQYQFEEAYDQFNKAIESFKSLGWHNQVKHIDLEISNVKEFEEKVKRVEISRSLMEQRLEDQRLFEVYEKSEEEKILEKTVDEVSNLTGEASKIIEKEILTKESAKQHEKEQLGLEAKKYGASMRKLIKLKEDLLLQIKIANEEKLKEKERIQKEKERKNVEDIKKMLKETMKKNKNN